MNETPGRLVAKDYATNTLQAILKSLPVVGPGLEQFIYGPAAELRLRRIEQTLREVAESIAATGNGQVETEEYVKLLEEVLPSLGRATSEDVRARFRDLLISSASLPSGDPKWADAELAATLLREVDAPGLALLAALSRREQRELAREPAKPRPELSIVARPVPHIVIGDFNYQHPSPEHEIVVEPVGYGWDVSVEWLHRLREKRLVYTRYGGDLAWGLTLSELGRFLVDWTLNDSAPAT